MTANVSQEFYGKLIKTLCLVLKIRMKITCPLIGSVLGGHTFNYNWMIHNVLKCARVCVCLCACVYVCVRVCVCVCVCVWVCTFSIHTQNIYSSCTMFHKPLCMCFRHSLESLLPLPLCHILHSFVASLGKLSSDFYQLEHTPLLVLPVVICDKQIKWM